MNNKKSEKPVSAHNSSACIITPLERIENIINKIGLDNIMKKPPCAFCGYNGQGYWNPKNHHPDCQYKKLANTCTEY